MILVLMLMSYCRRCVRITIKEKVGKLNFQLLMSYCRRCVRITKEKVGKLRFCCDFGVNRVIAVNIKELWC